MAENIFKVKAVIYNGSTPLWGYRLRVRKTSTGGEWFSEDSQTIYRCERLFFPCARPVFRP